MSANEQPQNETERRPEEVEARRPDAKTSAEGRHTPLFLRGRSDGYKGNEQDEKDEVGE